MFPHTPVHTHRISALLSAMSLYTLYEMPNPEDPTEKHIAVGFDYSLLDDFLNTWKKKKEDLASGKITKEEYFEWKINWPRTED